MKKAIAKKTTMKSGNVLLGIVAGAAAGALVGLLMAPEKGSKTRAQILSKGGDYADSFKGKFEEFLAAISETYESTEHKMADLFAKRKSQYDGAAKEMKM